ncbi:MAG: hypothetical protein KKD73_03090, partial [Proteobacteria bacterium]|nr:hypothetical protein [Pseudomonadota bacterium]MBU1639040.1 hypothetical protein [Pseudomonadota bacterium]
MKAAHHIQKLLLVASATLLLFSCPPNVARADILIIANPQAKITSLTHAELQAIYLSQTATWPNGLDVKLTMLTEEGPHQEFCQKFLNKSVPQHTRHLRRQLYTGKALPPVHLKTSSAVINYIRTTPGALGFIAEQTPPQGVIVVT